LNKNIKKKEIELQSAINMRETLEKKLLKHENAEI